MNKRQCFCIIPLWPVRLRQHIINNIKEARELIKTCIKLYNEERPHLSISMLTPNQVHNAKDELNTNRIFDILVFINKIIKLIHI
jgi:hypothetical protein